MKRILIAIHALSFDGAEKVAAMWANYLAQNGYKVSFLLRYRLEKEQQLDKNIEVYSIADTPFDYRYLSVFQRLSKVRKIAKDFAPDLIISLLPKMQMIVRLSTLGLKSKRFETIRNNPWLDKDVGRKRLLWNLCFLFSHRIILQTEEQAEYFNNWLKKKCIVVRNPLLKASEVKREYSDVPKRFIAIGRVSEQKNYPLMIKAFAKATEGQEDCTLDIYGSGTEDYVECIQEQIQEVRLNHRIKLRGRTDHVEAELIGHDVFLMSSDYEGMPNALAEAMAAGLVCLSTDCRTGPKDMIGSGRSGFLAKTGDVQSFADGISKILQMDSQQCAVMGMAAREKILTMCSEENTLVRLKQLIDTEL